MKLVAFFFPLQVHGGMQEYIDTTIECTVCATDLIRAKAPAVLPINAFASSLQMSAKVKRANNVLV